MNLFTYELRRRHKNVCSCRESRSSLDRHIQRHEIRMSLSIIRNTFLSSKLGSRTSAASASVEDLRGNKYLTPYFVPRFVPECMRACFDIGGPFYAGVRGTIPSYTSRSRTHARELWEFSEMLAAELI